MGLDVGASRDVRKLILNWLDADKSRTLLLTTHTMVEAEELCDRVAIMYFGRIVELADTRRLFETPAHPYTRMLLEAAPRLTAGQDLGAIPIPGEPPSMTAVPSGCVFRTRCAFAVARCAETLPALEPVAPGREVACHRWREVAAPGAARPSEA